MRVITNDDFWIYLDDDGRYHIARAWIINMRDGSPCPVISSIPIIQIKKGSEIDIEIGQRDNNAAPLPDTSNQP